MEHIEVKIIDNEIEIRIKIYPYRKYKTTFPTHFHKHGLNNFNPTEILTPNLINKDFSMMEIKEDNAYKLKLGFDIVNKYYELYMYEVFDNVEVTNIPGNFVEIFMNLSHKISYLENKISNLEKRLSQSEENYDDLNRSVNRLKHDDNECW